MSPQDIPRVVAGWKPHFHSSWCRTNVLWQANEQLLGDELQAPKAGMKSELQLSAIVLPNRGILHRKDASQRLLKLIGARPQARIHNLFRSKLT